jgi:hypothetical protein
LAAIYSISRQKGLTPEFFRRGEDIVQSLPGKGRNKEVNTKQKRTRLVLMWDFQNINLRSEEVSRTWNFMSKYLNLLFPQSGGNRILKAYTSPGHWDARQALEQAKFKVEQSYWNADSQIEADSKRECGCESQDSSIVIYPFAADPLWSRQSSIQQPSRQSNPVPQKTVYVLAANDGRYASLLKELQQAGVDVYLWATDDCNQQLIHAVGQDHFIPWHAPLVMMRCLEVIRKLKGEPIRLTEFGNKCQQKLDEDEVYPQDVGFRKSRPYGSLLTRLERMDIIQVTHLTGERDLVSIKL